jgi:hypothetical protein
MSRLWQMQSIKVEVRNSLNILLGFTVPVFWYAALSTSSRARTTTGCHPIKAVKLHYYQAVISPSEDGCFRIESSLGKIRIDPFLLSPVAA